jgi:hypothetical protein
MAEKNMEEEIIELTEVVEEDLNPAWKIGRETSPPVEPMVGVKKERMGEPEIPRKKLDLPPEKEEPTQKMETEPPRKFSPGAIAPKPISSQTYEPEVLELKDVLRTRVEEWISRQGVQIMEQIAREMFPKIAQDVLRREIEKIKAEAKDEE